MFRAATSVDTRKELEWNISPHNLPLLPITLLTISVQTRNSPRAKIAREPNRLDSTPSPARADQGIAGPPESVASVIHIPDNSKETARERLAFVLGLGFESRALDFAVPFDEEAKGVQRDADKESWRRALEKSRKRRLGAGLL